MQRTVFRTKKPDRTFMLMYIGFMLFLIAITFISYAESNDIWVLITFALVSAAISAFSFTSVYFLRIIIDEHHLLVHNVFVWFKGDIHHITKIRKGETMWSGFHKYGAATKGLIIFTRFKDDLYITPENEEEFVKKIMEINPEIVFEKV